MIIARTLEELRHAKELQKDKSLALVPTMGALHKGHMALVKRAKNLAPFTAVSIFVNPIQFDQQSDFQRYPKTEEADLELLKEQQVDLVWIPEVEAMYPKGFATRVTVGGPSLQWEGALRHGHFEGVSTVVSRLFALLKPQYACFGEKDWQQLQVIRRMVEDLVLPVVIEGVPIIREEDGLAKSSRNRFLTDSQRSRAALLIQTLRKAKIALEAGQNIAIVQKGATDFLEKNGFKVDYLAAVEGHSMEALDVWKPTARLIAAAHLGSVRLLDNL